MLIIDNTPNLTGIMIHGDYLDLNSLYDGLANYLRFYEKNNPAMGETYYECLMGLCYDLRHCYQGDRNIESVDNNYEGIHCLEGDLYATDETLIRKEQKKYQNGNLYFNVEVHYPWALFYLFGLQNILDDQYELNWFDCLDVPYTRLEMERDRTVIQLFLDLLWLNLKETLGFNFSNILLKYYENYAETSLYFQYPYSYVEALCQLYAGKASNQWERRSLLPLICYQLLAFDYDKFNEVTVPMSLKEKEEILNSYGDACNNAEGILDIHFITWDEFLPMFSIYAEKNPTMPDIILKDHFFRTHFGEVNWEELEW